MAAKKRIKKLVLKGGKTIKVPLKAVKPIKSDSSKYYVVALIASLIFIGGLLMWWTYSKGSEAAPVINNSVIKETPKPCNCTTDFEPVCSGKTLYQNKCTAICLGVKEYVEGECNDPAGKTFFQCELTTSKLSAQYNPVCAKVYRIDTKDYIWKTFANTMTACRAERSMKIEILGYTRGECSI
ncbi:MAG: hypothetical protein NT001_02555 [Candidatus Woesearchaeota archaeon]|nr:hypothetical protein [Candidatus Woesearchaeota archaeon]